MRGAQQSPLTYHPAPLLFSRISLCVSRATLRHLHQCCRPTRPQHLLTLNLDGTSFNNNVHLQRLASVVGIPGSGKSTMAGPLERAGWYRCSQDDFGRKETEKMAGIHSKVGRRCVLDRCNVEPAGRKEWLQLMHSPPAGRTAAIFFDVDTDECVRRVGLRTGHPTLVGGSSGSEKIIRESKPATIPRKI